ncbi:MAG: DnaJ domain-containing protein [Campylobacterales bacterium]|nr:DnaJ domain-containing protein [Campylobacterales bacterium]
MNKYKKWIYLGIVLMVLYYIFIVNFLFTISLIATVYVGFRVYKYYKRKQLNELVKNKDFFRQSELGLFVALVAKVAKADGRVQELEAQLIGIMFDDISKVFTEKEKARDILKDIFNEEKGRIDDTKEKARALNKALGRSVLKRRQFVGFLIQLAYVDNGIDDAEDKILRIIVAELRISPEHYKAMVNRFKNKMSGKQESMSLKEAYKILGVNETDSFDTVKKRYRELVRKYHPDIIKSQDKDESYMEEATAKTQEINQAYQVIKELNKQ